MPPSQKIGNIIFMANKQYPDAPRVAVGAVVLHQDKVLLVLRGQAPAKGMWAIPGGSVELGEPLAQAAEREVMEETGLWIRAGRVVHTFDAIQRDEAGQVEYHYVIVDLLAEALEPDQPLQPADDVADAAWFSLAELLRSDLQVSPATRELLQKLMGGPDDRS